MLRSILLIASVAAQAFALPSTDPFKKYTLSAPGINATFIGYGARITSLLVNDKNGNPQDVVVGYDNPTDYLKNDQTVHSYFGPIVGRYANRIKNGTFSVDGNTYQVPENENQGHDTLHGGTVGYDQRNWTVVAYNTSSITFGLLDPGYEGFPGSIITYATYTLSANRWTSRMVSIPLDKPTPIMLANHVYWNLDAFTTGPGQNILNNTLYMPYSDRIISIDNIEVPTGGLQAVAGGPYDFTTPKQLVTDNANSHQCGNGCTGLDNAFIIDRPRYSAPEATDIAVLQMASPVTGIAMTIKTNQQSIQVYNCIGQNGTIPVKSSQQHGGRGQTTYIEKYGCIVFETQQWIDGINHPEWGQSPYQIYSPDSEPYVSYTTYDFSLAVQVPKNYSMPSYR